MTVFGVRFRDAGGMGRLRRLPGGGFVHIERASSRPFRPALAAIVTAMILSGGARAQQACRQLPRGVVGWWTGDNTPNDVTLAANNGVLMNGATYGPGVFGNGFSLDGVNDRVDVADAANLHLQRFTLAAWVKLDAGPQSACIICKQYGSGDADSFSLWLNNGVLQGGMFTLSEAVSGTPFPVNQFVHAAVTYDGAIIRLYIDGKVVGRAPGPAVAIPYDANQVLIGAEDNGINAFTAFLKGTIDEAQIFGRALSDCEIRALAGARVQGFCKGDSDADLIPDAQDNCPHVSNAGQADADGDGAGDACDCNSADAGVVSSPGDRNELTFTSKDDLDWCGDPSLTGASTVYDVVRGELSSLPVGTGTPACRSKCVAPLSGLAGFWAGDDNTTDLVAANNGTLENGAAYGPGLTRDAFGFDGVNDRVRTGNLSVGSAFSFATWVNSNVVNQGAYKRIAETSFATDFEMGTDGTGLAYKFIVKTTAAPYGTVNGGTISPGDWQFVAGTYDGASGTLYVNGKAVASSAFPPPGPVSAPLYLGAYVGGGFGWNGRIDESQFYNRSLSASEVETLYEAGSAGTCKQALGGTDSQWTTPWAADASIPAPGHGYWYVYRGRNGCGVGSYGFATGGAERLTTVCN
jgi:hypothetical protein